MANSVEFKSLLWDVTHLGEAIEALAQEAHLVSHPVHAPVAPIDLATSDDDGIERWVHLVATHVGTEAEPIQSLYADVPALVRSVAPAILEMSWARDDSTRQAAQARGESPAAKGFLVLIETGRKVTLLTPDLARYKIDPQVLADALVHPAETPYIETVDEILSRAAVPSERRSRVRSLFLAEQLSSTQVVHGWMLRHSPGASYWKQARSARMLPLAVIVLVTILLQQGLLLASWGIIGGGALQGQFDWVWLWAWALLLLTGIPLQILMSSTGIRLGTHFGGIFRNVLLFGALKLEPEEIRREGIGHFLDRIMDADIVQYSALSSALSVLLATSQILSAFGVLVLGAGGWMSAGFLAGMVLLVLALGLEYWRTSQWGAGTYRQMTNNLVERLIGHRTRLAQQVPVAWHKQEDRELSQYLDSSGREARLGNWLGSLPQVWLILGLASTIGAFLVRGLDATALAISLGGVLLAQQALSAICSQIASLVPLTMAWRQVGPLFRAAQREPEKPIPAAFTFQNPIALQSGGDRAFEPLSFDAANARNGGAAYPSGASPLITLRNITFRYQERARLALQDVNLQINAQDRILVEGPSGGGKSTLASVLAGLRSPESGLLLLHGYDRTSVGSEAWRQQVVVAPQFHENHVFAETFGFNLLMGRRWPPTPEDEAEAVEICGELGLDDLLARMPSGLHQIVGESGWQLSHGERSRLYIARALLQRAQCIILDESFAALDPENLARAMECVLKRAPTLLVIAHP